MKVYQLVEVRHGDTVTTEREPLVMALPPEGTECEDCPDGNSAAYVLVNMSTGLQYPICMDCMEDDEYLKVEYGY